MIRSMTAFGNARAESSQGNISIEIRTVNSRFLDINFRLPDDLRALEGGIREKLSVYLTRGKVDIRANYLRAHDGRDSAPDENQLQKLASQLALVRQYIPDVAAPRLSELLNSAESPPSFLEDFGPLCMQALDQALIELQATREREGKRLATIMLE